MLVSQSRDDPHAPDAPPRGLLNANHLGLDITLRVSQGEGEVEPRVHREPGFRFEESSGEAHVSNPPGQMGDPVLAGLTIVRIDQQRLPQRANAARGLPERPLGLLP